jgi:hypothetical protein
MKQRRSLRPVVAAVDPPDPEPETPEDPIETTAVTIRHEQLQEWTPRFVLSVDEAVHMVEQKREFFQRVMRPDEHYGKIPGTGGKKPTLLKPGAELLCASMGLHPVFRDAAPPVLDYTGETHGGEPFIQYRRICELRRQTGQGPDDYMVVAWAEGVCNSWESKYRWRESKRKCPNCSRETIIVGKQEYGGGFVCFKRIGGCGTKFQATDQRILSQQIGKVINPDVLDLENTILKMADKRALVASVLVGTGCSDLFTQDLEDDAPRSESAYGGEEPPGPEEEIPSPATPTSAPTSRRPKSASPPATPAPASAAPAKAAPTSAPVTTSAPPATANTAGGPSGALEGPSFGEENGQSHDLGPLRVKALELASKSARIFTEKKYPGQVFSQGQLEAQARRSMESFLQTKRGGKTFQTADQDDLIALVEAIEKSLSTVPNA